MDLDREKVENLTKEKYVILVAGTLNATGKTLWWKSEGNIEIGDYALVENMQDYDLIKVIGILVTSKSMAGKFSNAKYENMKRVIKKINIE